MNCPWCSCEPKKVGQGFIKWAPEGQFERRCGSYKHGIEPWRSKNCELNVAETEVERLEGEIKRLQGDMETAWCIIANAYGGDWEQASAEWKAAAIRWREAWGRVASSVKGSRPEEALA